jgi:hypothetical protein
MQTTLTYQIHVVVAASLLLQDMTHVDGDSIFWWGVNVVNPAHSAPGVLELQKRGAPHTW